MRRVACGSPAYFEKQGVPLTTADLKQHRVVASTSAWVSTEWKFGGEQRVTVDPALQCNSNEAATATAVSGWG